MQPNIDISVENRKKSAERLNLLLADEFVLYTKTLNFHWNIEGMQFHDLHKFLEDQYEDVLENNEVLVTNEDILEQLLQQRRQVIGSLELKKLGYQGELSADIIPLKNYCLERASIFSYKYKIHKKKWKYFFDCELVVTNRNLLKSDETLQKANAI